MNEEVEEKDDEEEIQGESVSVSPETGEEGDSLPIVTFVWIECFVVVHDGLVVGKRTSHRMNE